MLVQLGQGDFHGPNAEQGAGDLRPRSRGVAELRGAPCFPDREKKGAAPLIPWMEKIHFAPPKKLWEAEMFVVQDLVHPQ